MKIQDKLLGVESQEKPKLVYIASPYTARHPEGHRLHSIEHDRYMTVLRYVRKKMLERKFVYYSPIVHGHHVELLSPGEIPYETYIKAGLEMLRVCDMLEVLCIEGWIESKGVQEEINFAETLSIPIIYIYPRSLS